MHQEPPDSHVNTTRVITMQIGGHLRGTMEKKAIATHGIVGFRKKANLTSSTNKTPSIGETLL